MNGETVFCLSDVESDLTSLDDSEYNIPKPQGEVGRPNHGGYQLEDTLDWPQDLVVDFKVSVCNVSPLDRT